MPRRVLILLTLAATVPVADAAGHYRSTGRNCGTIQFTPQTDEGASAIRATGASCRTARRIVKSWHRGNRSPLRFRCSDRRHDGATLAHSDVVCKRSGARVTWAAS